MLLQSALLLQSENLKNLLILHMSATIHMSTYRNMKKNVSWWFPFHPCRPQSVGPHHLGHLHKVLKWCILRLFCLADARIAIDKWRKYMKIYENIWKYMKIYENMRFQTIKSRENSWKIHVSDPPIWWIANACELSSFSGLNSAFNGSCLWVEKDPVSEMEHYIEGVTTCGSISPTKRIEIAKFRRSEFWTSVAFMIPSCFFTYSYRKIPKINGGLVRWENHICKWPFSSIFHSKLLVITRGELKIFQWKKKAQKHAHLMDHQNDLY